MQDVANAPVEIVTDLADRVRRAWRTRKSRTPRGVRAVTDEPEPAAEEPQTTMPEPPLADDSDPDLPDA